MKSWKASKDIKNIRTRSPAAARRRRVHSPRVEGWAGLLYEGCLHTAVAAAAAFGRAYTYTQGHPRALASGFQHPTRFLQPPSRDALTRTHVSSWYRLASCATASRRIGKDVRRHDRVRRYAYSRIQHSIPRRPRERVAVLRQTSRTSVVAAEWGSQFTHARTSARDHLVTLRRLRASETYRGKKF